MKTALYTTFYPAMLPYQEAFLTSVAAQTDSDFDVWIALDGVENVDYNDAQFFYPDTNLSIAEIREYALTKLCQSYDAIILVDSDDELLPYRVAAAKKGLDKADVYACALALINEKGENLELEFTLAEQRDWPEFLSRVNVFGFSNTAYKTEVLADCFPIPAQTVMVDWLVALKALDKGAKLLFDSDVHMNYRQYETNTARVLPPYTPQQIKRATRLILQHYELSLGHLSNQTVKQVQARHNEVIAFASFLNYEEALTIYTHHVNTLKPVFHWWEVVAHKELEYLWKK